MAFFILAFMYSLLLVSSSKGQASNRTIPAIIAFGDSIVDNGNNNDLNTIMKSNFPPYGKDFQGHIPTGRFSNGKITTDFIASKLGVKELLPAYKSPKLGPQDLLTGVSFASGGSGYDPETAASVSVISMSQQLDMFREYKGKLKTLVGENKTESILKNSLYIVCSGSNDAVTYFSPSSTRKNQYDIPSYVEFLVETTASFLMELISTSGAQKIGVFGIPPIGCVPSQRTIAGGILRKCGDDLNHLAQLYNSNISTRIDDLQAKYQERKLIFVDIYPTLLELINNPQTHGFEDSKDGCCCTGKFEVSILCNNITSAVCADDSKYVFWDSYHPSQRAYEILVEELIAKYIKFLN